MYDREDSFLDRVKFTLVLGVCLPLWAAVCYFGMAVIVFFAVVSDTLRWLADKAQKALVLLDPESFDPGLAQAAGIYTRNDGSVASEIARKREERGKDEPKKSA